MNGCSRLGYRLRTLLADPAALVALRALTMATLAVLLLGVGVRSGLSPAAALVLSLACVAGARGRFFVRPELVTLLIVPTAVWLFLRRARIFVGNLVGRPRRSDDRRCQCPRRRPRGAASARGHFRCRACPDGVSPAMASEHDHRAALRVSPPAPAHCSSIPTDGTSSPCRSVSAGSSTQITSPTRSGSRRRPRRRLYSTQPSPPP